jgi:hypothetical protein
VAQLVSANAASAATYSQVSYYHNCSSLSLSADFAPGTVWSEVSYGGGDGCSGAATAISASLWQCVGATCGATQFYDTDAYLGHDSFFARWTSQVTTANNYTYMFCVTLRNDYGERYYQVCTDQVG